MKTCNKCNLDKDDSEFFFKNKKKQIRSNTCRSCSLEYAKIHYKENKQKYLVRAKRFNKNQASQNRIRLFEFLKGKQCKRCGQSDIRVLEFDHRDRLDKTDNVGNMLHRYSWNTILKEIEKCDILCANCHRIKTVMEFEYFRCHAG